MLSAIEAAAKSGIRTKVNTVLLRENFGAVPALAGLAKRLPADVRFIESVSYTHLDVYKRQSMSSEKSAAFFCRRKWTLRL